MKKTIIIVVVVILVGAGIYYFTRGASKTTDNTQTSSKTSNSSSNSNTATTDMSKPEESIGKSVEGRDIMAYHFGTGAKEILFVGGLHGGYEWNTSLVAYEAIDYLKANPTAVPAGVKVTIIPVANPDGLFKVTNKDGRFTKADVSSSQATQVAGRFNANDVDLNRNFDCDWKANAIWQTTPVSGGAKAFSEPESIAIRDYVAAHTPTAAVVWYSSAGGVFASNCHSGVLPETNTLTDIFSKASGYKAYQEFNFYEVTGDMVNWLAKQNIPAISILLTTHESTEWTKNEAGIKAILAHYAQ